jgi:type II secretory pathway pseudopilin PulG
MTKLAHRRRRGLTLLELIVTSVLLTTLITSVTLVLRSARTAWQAHEDDAARIHAAHATLRHVIRKLRQGAAVTAITAASDPSGSIAVTMSDGTTATWARNNATNEVYYGTAAADQLLAEHITQLTFTGYQSDGATATTTPSEIRAVKCQVRVNLPRDTGGTRDVVCWAWLRSW